jgi:excisionase family DNA binding protein
MAKAPDRPRDTQALLYEELRSRGMSEIEIEMALRKKKRRAPLTFNAVKQDHVMWPQINAARSPFITVEAAAQQLSLHPKTVLRFIHEGRLPAKRVGKSYRILDTDLQAFGGRPEPTETTAAETASVTTIVDIPNIAPDLARKWQQTVSATLAAKPRDGAPLNAETVYDPARAHLKIIITGAPHHAANLMSLIPIWIEQLTA